MLWWTLRKLQSSDPAVRVAAIRSLEADPRSEAEHAIIRALRNWDDRELRAAAAHALSRRRSDHAIRALVDFADLETDSELCGIACDSLFNLAWQNSIVRFDDLEMRVFEKALRFGNEFTRRAAIHAREVRSGFLRGWAGKRQRAEQVNKVESVSTSRDDVKKRVATAAKFGPPLWPKNDGEREQQWKLITQLVEIGAPAVEPLLDILCNGENACERIVAGTALGQMREALAVQPLVNILATYPGELKEMVWNSLRRMDKGAVIDALRRHIDSVEVLEFLDRLGWQPQTGLERACAAALQGKWEHIFALGSIGNKFIDEVISGKRQPVTKGWHPEKNGDLPIRLALVRTLAARGDDRALKVAEPFLCKEGDKRMGTRDCGEPRC
jgi:HEAT repeat protein